MSLYPGLALGAAAGLASNRGHKAIVTGSAVAGLTASAVHSLWIGYRMYAPVLFAQWGIGGQSSVPTPTGHQSPPNDVKSETSGWWKPIRKMDSETFVLRIPALFGLNWTC